MSDSFLTRYRKLENGPYGFLADIVLFALITYSFHLIFRFYAAEIMSIPFVIHSGEWLSHTTYLITVWFDRNVLGMNFETRPVNEMWFANGHGIAVNSSCSGLKQHYQVLVLFLLFPGPWKQKLWFIPMSMLVMAFVNLMRIQILSLVMPWRPDYFEFIHTWVLRPFFYVVLFFLWVWWVEKFKNRRTAGTGSKM
jgi:exosortase/archaeosortase family protein